MKRICPLALVFLLLAAACSASGAQSAGEVTTLPPQGEPVVGTGSVLPSSSTTTEPTPAEPPTTGIQDSPGTTEPPPTTTTEPDLPPRATKVYFLMDGVGDFRGGPFLVPVHRQIPGTLNVATNSTLALIAGPTADSPESELWTSS